MKKITKLLTFVAIVPMLLACDQNGGNPEYGNQDSYKVGILLPVEHSALNAAAEGFKQGLKEAGMEEKVTFLTKNAEANADTQRTMAKQIISECDLALGLGTGASRDLVSAQKNRGSKKAILFSAVTDPVNAELVTSLDAPGGMVTGSSDAQPVADQIGIVKEWKSDASRVGVFYTLSETNSEVQALQAKAAIEAAGMTYVPKTCTAANDIQTSLAALINSNVDAIYIPTDNNVAANMNYVSNAVKGKNILVIVGEEGMLKSGGHITISVSYSNLGKRTGEMAAKILKGEKTPGELPVITMAKEDCVSLINSDFVDEAGITLPTSILNSYTDVGEKK